MLNQRKKYKKTNIKYIRKQIFILFLIVMCLISTVTVLSRFVTNNLNDFHMRSLEFYFFSDKLSEDRSVFQIENWSGVDQYTITVNMNSRKNNIEVASYDIGYDITYRCLTNNAICQLNKESGIIYADTNSDIFNLTITPNTQLNTGDKVVVEIEATSTSKYTKTLKGEFTLVVGKENLSYQITDNPQNLYMDLRITNTLSYYIVEEAFDNYTVGQKIDVDKYLQLTDDKMNKCYSSEVTIAFDPRKILLDITNEYYAMAKNIQTTNVDGEQYISGFTIRIDAISSADIRFYKLDISENYSYPNSENKSIVTISNR